ncbi:MAG TPA: eL32 family ribosomal protein, partial [Candidatus Micrarchaeota archaeon]|nr:eL32 family ribosomal protein [Candidatus Micrarchaeota archaeon]
MVSKKKHPTFKRTNFGRTRRSRVKDNWRRPRGIDNKQREKYAYMGKLPSIGYKNPKALRGRHPSGLYEVIVSTPAQVAGLKDVVVRVAGSVGAKKAAPILKELSDDEA